MSLMEMSYFNPHHHAGGDPSFLHINSFSYYFNPHHHAGGDDGEDLTGSKKAISIHTTTQVVTRVYIINPVSFADFNPHHHAGGDSKSTQLFILISVNFHINLLLQPLTTSKPSKSIPKTPTIPDSPGANLPGVSWVLPIRTGVSEN